MASSKGDERVKAFQGNLLRGVVVLARHDGERADHKVFRGEPEDLCELAGIVKSTLPMQ